VVDYQTVAPAEMRSPIAQEKSADGSMATGATWLKTWESDTTRKTTPNLTLTGLLMEGVLKKVKLRGLQKVRLLFLATFRSANAWGE
jgi:hypothetical protein